MWQCKVAPSLGGGFDGTPYETWDVSEYTVLDNQSPCVFFGMYGLPDFYTLWRHKTKGEKHILWAGSDILHFTNGYWLEDGGGIRLDPTPLAQWINKNCTNWVENKVEYDALHDIGIESTIVPSFLGNVDNYKIEYKYNERPNVYLSANPGREEEYGWGMVEEIADKCGLCDFHLYGSAEWKTKHSNVFIHGRVPKEQMNKEIKEMQCGLRLNQHMDGFSEVLAKALLWGQYPFCWRGYGYAGIESFRNKEELIQCLNSLTNKKEPNVKGREWLLGVVNSYPWNQRK